MTHAALPSVPENRSCGGWPTATRIAATPHVDSLVPDYCDLMHRLLQCWQGTDRGTMLAEGHTHRDREILAAEVAREIATLEARLANNWLAGCRAAFSVDSASTGNLMLLVLRDRLECDPESVVALFADALRDDFEDIADSLRARSAGRNGR